MSVTVSVRELRENLAALISRVAAGDQVVVTRRGRAIARLIPENRIGDAETPRYPLRGSVLRMSKDFDEPLDRLWEALEK
jgi:prevent-host-death family protein